MENQEEPLNTQDTVSIPKLVSSLSNETAYPGRLPQRPAHIRLERQYSSKDPKLTPTEAVGQTPWQKDTGASVHKILDSLLAEHVNHQ